MAPPARTAATGITRRLGYLPPRSPANRKCNCKRMYSPLGFNLGSKVEQLARLGLMPRWEADDRLPLQPAFRPERHGSFDSQSSSCSSSSCPSDRSPTRPRYASRYPPYPKRDSMTSPRDKSAALRAGRQHKDDACPGALPGAMPSRHRRRRRTRSQGTWPYLAHGSLSVPGIRPLSHYVQQCNPAASPAPNPAARAAREDSPPLEKSRSFERTSYRYRNPSPPSRVGKASDSLLAPSPATATASAAPVRGESPRKRSGATTLESDSPAPPCPRRLEHTPKNSSLSKETAPGLTEGHKYKLGCVGSPQGETPKNSARKKDADAHLRRTPSSASRGKARRVERTSSCEEKAEEGAKPARRAMSPAEIKPKALIKPGLRSTKKDPSRKRAHNASLFDKGSPAESGCRKFVQRTLEAFRGFSSTKSPKLDVVETEASKDEEPARSRGHVRKIYQEQDKECKLQVQAVVRLSQLTMDQAKKAMKSPEPGRRTAEVSPTPSPVKKRSCDSPTLPPAKAPRMSPAKLTSLSPAKATDTARSSPAKFTESSSFKITRSSPAKVTRSSPAKVTRSSPAKVTRCSPAKFARTSPSKSPSKQGSTVADEEDAQARKDEERRREEAAQRSKKRHSRGYKVFVYCDVLGEHLERHPVQNEIPSAKWSKWLNPSQLRCLVSTMLENTDMCLNFSLEGKTNDDWECQWMKLAMRLNTICFNKLTQLNTGLRMTVPEWKATWIDIKTRLTNRVNDMTPEERVHNLGLLECLLFSESLYQELLMSNGACLGKHCPRMWCVGACKGIPSPSWSIDDRKVDKKKHDH